MWLSAQWVLVAEINSAGALFAEATMPKLAVAQVWVKPAAEMQFLYGNHVLKSGLGRITEATPAYTGVVVYSMTDVPLGAACFPLSAAFTHPPMDFAPAFAATPSHIRHLQLQAAACGSTHDCLPAFCTHRCPCMASLSIGFMQGLA